MWINISAMVGPDIGYPAGLHENAATELFCHVKNKDDNEAEIIRIMNRTGKI